MKERERATGVYDEQSLRPSEAGSELYRYATKSDDVSCECERQAAAGVDDANRAPRERRAAGDRVAHFRRVPSRVTAPDEQSRGGVGPNARFSEHPRNG